MRWWSKLVMRKLQIDTIETDLENPTVRDDVIVVDLFGKVKDGTFAGDNLGNSIYAKTGDWIKPHRDMVIEFRANLAFTLYRIMEASEAFPRRSQSSREADKNREERPVGSVKRLDPIWMASTNCLILPHSCAVWIRQVLRMLHSPVLTSLSALRSTQIRRRNTFTGRCRFRQTWRWSFLFHRTSRIWGRPQNSIRDYG